MRILLKSGDEIILEDEKEGVEIGDNIVVFDNYGRGILIQLIEMNFYELNRRSPPADNLLSAEKVKATSSKRNYRYKILMEAKKLNGEIKLSDWSGWIPGEIKEALKVKLQWLLECIKGPPKYSIDLGKTADREKLLLDAFYLQGITLIVGKKGSGKSHLSKLILRDLIKKGCRLIVFDINDEYSDLKCSDSRGKEGGGPVKGDGKNHEEIITLNPGENLKFSLEYVGMDVLYEVLTVPLRLPEISAISFRNIWSYLEKKNYLRIHEFFKAVNSENNPYVREALFRRMQQILATNIFSDEEKETLPLDVLLKRMEKGGAIIINLKKISQVAKIITVQTILSKLQRLLEIGEQPLWIIAEEAHFYLPKTSWEDIVTRMRHIGAYQIYVTNSPQSLPEMIIRQSDNIFLFKLVDKADIAYISPATNMDADTLTAIVKSLPFRKCLITGEITNSYPFVVMINPIETGDTGATRLFLK